MRFPSSSRTVALASLAALAFACSSEVVAPSGGSESTGSGGAAGGDPNGGAAVSSSATTGSSSSSASSSSSGGGIVCGGFGGAMCPGGMFCDYPNDFCGGDDSTGVCDILPDNCPPDCPGVCGCDGMFYCSACVAHANGVDVSANSSCASPGEQYSAFLWLGGLDHLIVRKADPMRDVCVELYLDAPMQNAPGFNYSAPQSFGVSHAIITDSAADCMTQQPMGAVHNASGGNGVLSWTVAPGMYYPCELDIDAVIAFPQGPAWVKPVELMKATAITVEGGCL